MRRGSGAAAKGEKAEFHHGRWDPASLFGTETAWPVLRDFGDDKPTGPCKTEIPKHRPLFREPVIAAPGNP